MVTGLKRGGIGHGTVTAFDDARGVGQLREDPGGAVLGFHCTAVSNGSRHIDEGAKVCFTRRGVVGGRIEADVLVEVTAV